MALPNKYHLKRECGDCDGTGKVSAGDPLVELVCLTCGGTGSIKPYEVDKIKEGFEEIEAKIQDLQNVVDKIWNKVK